MYTFNRNKECTSLSQFMATGQKIVEEEDYDESSLGQMSVGDLKDRQSTTDSQKMALKGGGGQSKLNEDFMFDMDNRNTLL